MSSIFMRTAPIRSGLRPGGPLSVSAAGSGLMFSKLGCGVIGFSVGRKVSAADIVAIRGYCARNVGGKIRIFPDEFRHATDRKADQIVEDEHLAVAIGARADTDGGNAQLFRNARRQLAR